MRLFTETFLSAFWPLHIREFSMFETIASQLFSEEIENQIAKTISLLCDRQGLWSANPKHNCAPACLCFSLLTKDAQILLRYAI